MFRDLSCLIGLIYYCTWLDENEVPSIRITDLSDLAGMAEEIAALIQSPEFYRILRAKEQDVEKTRSSKKSLPKPEKRSPPALYVIENQGYLDPFMPDPALV